MRPLQLPPLAIDPLPKCLIQRNSRRRSQNPNLSEPPINTLPHPPCMLNKSLTPHEYTPDWCTKSPRKTHRHTIKALRKLTQRPRPRSNSLPQPRTIQMQSTMSSCTTPSSLKRKHSNHCIEGWVADQWDLAELDFLTPSWTRHDMDDFSEPPTRSASPSKKQRTSVHPVAFVEVKHPVA